MERVKGIEPSCIAWKAIALPLSYTRNLSFRGTEIRTQNKSSQRTRDSRFTMPRLLPFYIIFPFSRQRFSLLFNGIFGMNDISRPRSSIGQSDGLLIRRLCVRFAPRTHVLTYGDYGVIAAQYPVEVFARVQIPLVTHILQKGA